MKMVEWSYLATVAAKVDRNMKLSLLIPIPRLLKQLKCC